MKEKAKGKKKMVILGIILLVIVLLVAGTVYLMTGPKNEDALSEPIAGEDGTRSLVVYFSRSNVINAHGDVDAMTSASLNISGDRAAGATELVARRIQEQTGADLYALQTETYYRPSYMDTAMRALYETMFHMRPALAAAPENLDDYDVIYIGYEAVIIGLN